MTDVSDTEYRLTIKRTDVTEFEASYDNVPQDAFGKKMVALMLFRIVEELDPEFADIVRKGGPNA